MLHKFEEIQAGKKNKQGKGTNSALIFCYSLQIQNYFA